MSEDFDQFTDEQMEQMRNRFFEMKNLGESIYFDVSEYEALIDSFFEAEDIQNIEFALEMALEQHPGNHDFLLKKAQLFAINGEDELGLSILDDLTGIATDPDYFMIKGTILSNLQKYTEAIEEYTKALNQGQDLEEVYSNIAFEYENLEQFDKAIEYLKKVVEINPESESALNELGLCYEMADESEQSVVFFNEFIDQMPYSRSAWFNLAIAYNSLGKNKKAIDAYEYSLAIDPHQPSALFNIANIYAGIENHPKAIDYYRETLSKESPDAITYYYMGESFEKMDRFDDALEAYTNSNHINNQFHEAILGMARCHFSIGSEEEAFKQIETAIQLEEPFPLFWSIRCLKLDELGFFRLAYVALKKLHKQYPSEITYCLSLAVLLHNYDEQHSLQIIDDALLAFHEAKDQALSLYLKGLYQMKMNLKKEGLAAFELAISLDKEEISNPLIQSELKNNPHPDITDLLDKYELS